MNRIVLVLMNILTLNAVSRPNYDTLITCNQPETDGSINSLPNLSTEIRHNELEYISINKI